ncbi:LysM peptidoglycan-binding domain-containing protein [Pseudorhodoplanes sp.]|uniref:LysM peptidoglycan-binding domain-containing protein n=1 Tax=Pseudorhodoplanes sp. TaxID=1934341 RepID=UPI003919A2F1
MTGQSATRNALIVLAAAVAIGIGLLWWLTGHPEWTQRSAVKPGPAVEAERPSPATSSEKPVAKAITEAAEAGKELGGGLAPSKPEPSQSALEIDVARIEQSGDTVIAGRAPPNTTIELLLNGEVHDRAVVDSSGAFVLTPKPLPPGKFELTLRATEPNGTRSLSKQAIAGEIAAPKQKEAVAALTPPAPAPAPASPVSPSVAAPPAPSRGAAETKPEADIRVDIVEAQDGGKLYVSGRSTPGSTVRLYLNETYLATGTASPEGQFSFFIGGGMIPGEYRLRLEQVGASQKVQSRAEVSFKSPPKLAAAAPPAAPNPPGIPPAGSQQDPAAPETPPAAAAPAARIPQPASPAAAAAPERSIQTGERPAPPPASDPVVAARPGATHRSAPAAGTAESPAKPATQDMTQPAIASPQNKTAEPNLTEPVPSSQATAAVAGDRAAPPAAARSNASTDPRPDLAIKRPETASKSVVAARNRPDTVVVPNIDTRTVVRGDSLWHISRATYGHGIRYPVIYRANRNQIRNPDLIYPGQIFVLPKAER